MKKSLPVALIIDRNQGARKSLASVLRQAQLASEIIQASSAKEAMSAVSTAKSVGFVFCDTALPDQDCFELITELKRTPACKAAPVILMSTQSSKELLIKAASGGVNDFIKKPFTSRTLLVKLKRLSGGQEVRASRRHSLFGAYKANMAFDEKPIDGQLLDLSLGGCLINCPAVKSANCSVYARPEITISLGNSTISLKGEIVRIERNPDSEEKSVNIAFEFVDIPQEIRGQISNFLTELNKPKSDSTTSLKKTA